MCSKINQPHQTEKTHTLKIQGMKKYTAPAVYFFILLYWVILAMPAAAHLPIL